MNAARLKWIALMAAFAILTHFASGYRGRSVREFATSAQIYWRADRAIVTVTTAAEVRNEGLAATTLRNIGKLANFDVKPELRVGTAHVYSLENGVWQEYKLNPALSPRSFALWPYDGVLYTFDGARSVREWRNGGLLAAAPERAVEVRQAFAGGEDNYAPATSNRPYSVVQDAITRNEWRAYENLTATPQGKPLQFQVAGRTLELLPHHTPGGELSLAVAGADRLQNLWQAQALPRTITRAEWMQYMSARPLTLISVHDRLRRMWLDIGGSLLLLALLWAIFLRPLLLTGVPAAILFVDADEDEFPELDRSRWNDYTARLEALGFERVRDVKILNMLNAGISRVFLHPDSNCYASVFQCFAPKAPGLLFGYVSYLGEDWTVGHGVMKPIPGSAVNRLGHRLSFSRPGSSLEALYHEHVSTRDQIATGLGLCVVEPCGFDTYQQRSDLDAAARRNLVRRNPFLLAFRVYCAKFQPLSNDWWGDFPKEYQRSTGQKFVFRQVQAWAGA